MRTFRVWADALRIHQWSKNLLIFVPLFLGHAFNDFSKIVTVIAAFLLLCLLVAGTYIVNDLADLKADRSHPHKRNRPFASKRLSPRSGIVVASLLIATAILLSLYLPIPFTISLLVYLFLTSAYSFDFRRRPLLDVSVIAILFTMRIVMGVVVIGLPQSPWLLSFSLTFFLALAMAKRHGELKAAGENRKLTFDRGYRSDDSPLTITFGISAGMASIIIMLLYIANDAAPSAFYRDLAWLYVIPMAITLWMMRIWFFAHRGALHSDPVIFALTDWPSLCIGAVVASAFILALYVHA